MIENTATQKARRVTVIVHGQHEPRRVDVVLGPPLEKNVRERLTGCHAMSHSVMVMAMCCACDIWIFDISPTINCLNFMGLNTNNNHAARPSKIKRH
mmetsp:Transcript_40978/g.73894  ORF Transcript_40978/g.73894 Transcript_40978/m.73894 type:complete len:97 (-) Transcript_40978:321-611(-)